MTNSPLISIIIPSWNTATWLGCCLNSVLSQSYRNIEVIVVDDCSLDASYEILQKYAERDNRILIHRGEQQQGPGACRNIGIGKARGGYILFLDSDDFLTEGILDALMTKEQSCNDISIFNGIAFQEEDKSIIHAKYLPFEKDYFEGERIKEKYLLNLYDSHTPCMKLYTAEFLNRNQIRFPESIYGEDVEFWIRCLLANPRIDYFPYFGYMRRYRENSIMTSGSNRNITDRFDNIASLLELTKANEHLHRYIIDYYIRGLCQRAIIQDRILYRCLFNRLICLSKQYSLGISQALVSVVIPVYNPGEEFLDTINSVLNQTHIDFEVIVVDDGSQENVEGMVGTFTDDRISYYRLPHRNANVARNWGIRMAKGRYIAMLDADDLWKSTHLADCINTLEQSDADGLYGDLILRYSSGREQRVTVALPQKNEAMINYLLRTGYGAQTSTLFFTAESIKNVNWDETLNRHQDYDLVIRYSKQYRFTVKNNPTVIYRCSPKSQKIDFSSCIRVIEDNKEDIEVYIYHSYNKNMLQLVVRQEVEPKIIQYYRKESSCCVEYVSFIQYLLIHAPKTRIELQQLKQEYIGYIVDIEIEL